MEQKFEFFADDYVFAEDLQDEGADDDGKEDDGDGSEGSGRTLKVRLDKWLWAARFFKTRALARAAVEAGKVYYNGERSKPSREIEVGSILQVRQGRIEKTVIVKGLSTRRRSTDEALQLFEETEESIALREQYAMDWGPTHQQFQNEYSNSAYPDQRERRGLRFLRRSFGKEETQPPHYPPSYQDPRHSEFQMRPPRQDHFRQESSSFNFRDEGRSQNYRQDHFRNDYSRQDPFRNDNYRQDQYTSRQEHHSRNDFLRNDQPRHDFRQQDFRQQDFRQDQRQDFRNNSFRNDNFRDDQFRNRGFRQDVWQPRAPRGDAPQYRNRNDSFNDFQRNEFRTPFRNDRNDFLRNERYDRHESSNPLKDDTFRSPPLQRDDSMQRSTKPSRRPEEPQGVSFRHDNFRNIKFRSEERLDNNLKVPQFTFEDQSQSIKNNISRNDHLKGNVSKSVNKNSQPASSEIETFE